jgi:hypothetical protein
MNVPENSTFGSEPHGENHDWWKLDRYLHEISQYNYPSKFPHDITGFIPRSNIDPGISMASGPSPRLQEVTRAGAWFAAAREFQMPSIARSGGNWGI